MVLIPIHVRNDTFAPLPPFLAKLGSDQVFLVELQGEFVAEGDTRHQTVGKLEIDALTNTPTLQIGHHLLHGKIQALPKPYAVLARDVIYSDTNEPVTQATMAIDEATDDLIPPPSGISYTILSIVKSKIVFAKRPVPIVPESLKRDGVVPSIS